MLLKAYAGVLIFVAAMPFSFSFDAGLVKRSVESATWVPFGATAAYHSTAETALAADNYYQFSFTKWQSMKCWSRWAGETVSFGVLVWLAQPLLRRHYGFGRRGAAALIWWLCGGFAICLSGPHLIMVTRNFDVTDILFRWLGIGLGLTVRSLYARPAADRGSEAMTGRWPRGVTLACAATLAYIVYVSVIPLTFSAPEGGMGRAVLSAEFLPFFGYFVTRFDLMMDDVMEKLLVYALLGALLATCSRRLQALSMWSRVATLATIGVMIAIPLEVVQMFIPIRVASLTDLILAGCGCAAGAIGQEHAVGFYRFATSAKWPTSTGPPREGPASPVPSPTEVLFDSLLDEDPAAPVEPSPTRKPTPRP
jgi:VanZ family protein